MSVDPTRSYDYGVRLLPTEYMFRKELYVSKQSSEYSVRLLCIMNTCSESISLSEQALSILSVCYAVNHYIYDLWLFVNKSQSMLPGCVT